MRIDYAIAFKKANNAHNAGDVLTCERYGRIWMLMLAIKDFEHGSPILGDYTVAEFEADVDRALHGSYDDVLTAMYG